MRLVAEYGDACNVVASPSELARKYGLLKEHCAHVGRDYNSITRTSMSHCIIGDSDEEARAAIPAWAPVVFPGDIGSYGLIGTPETIRERIAAYADAGVQELVLRFHEPFTTDIVRRFASEFAVTTPKFAVPALT